MTRTAPIDIRIFPDLASASLAAADLMLSLARAGVAAHDRFAVALSGGTTPRQLYALLAAPPYREIIPWPKLHIFWADERCIPPDHPESNYRLAADSFLTRVSIPSQNIHRIQGEEGPDKAAEAYEEELRNFFDAGSLPRFDLVLLGAGEDGHTASLFPGSSVIRERKRYAAPVHLDPPRISRITLTLPVLNNSDTVLFLVSGARKSRVVHEIIEDGNPNACPAGLVRPVNGTLFWMLDQQAGAALTGSFDA